MNQRKNMICFFFLFIPFILSIEYIKMNALIPLAARKMLTVNQMKYTSEYVLWFFFFFFFGLQKMLKDNNICIEPLKKNWQTSLFFKKYHFSIVSYLNYTET